MKRKIFGMLLVGSMSVFMCGCENKKVEEKVEDRTPRIICSEDENEEKIKTSTKATFILRDNTYVKEYVAEIKMIFDNEETYKLYAEAVKNNSNDEIDKDVEYKYEVDDTSKTVITTMKVSITDERFNQSTEEEKNEMKIKPLVESAEKSGAKCDFKNVTRGDIGL